MCANEKISKIVVFYHMLIFWVLVYFVIMLTYYLSIINVFHINYLRFEYFILGTSIFCISFLTFAAVHHIRALFNKATGRLFTSERGNGLLMRIFRPSSVKNGIFIGVKLDTYLKRTSKKEFADKLIDYILSKNYCTDTPIILRSHLLSSQGIRNYIVKNIEKNGGNCFVQVGLQTDSKFMLLWLTPAFQGVFQLYIPALRQYEAEVIITFSDTKAISKC